MSSAENNRVRRSFENALQSSLPLQLLGWASMAAAFCVILITVTRINPDATIILSVVLPAVLIGSNAVHFARPRITQLFVITSYFMLVACASIVAITTRHEAINRYLEYFFFVYFAVQGLGFVIDQTKKRSFFGVGATIGGLAGVSLWGISVAGSGSAIDTLGRFQLWGENAPWLIQAVYLLWATIPLLESRALPKLSELCAHMTAIFVAMLSGQFFFARLLTASQLFLVDGMLRYTNRDFVSDSFLALDAEQMNRFKAVRDRWISPALCAILWVLVVLSWYESAVRLGVI